MRSKAQQKLAQLKAKHLQPQIGEPGWSNYLLPIDQLNPPHDFQCQCSMCTNYQQKKFNQALNEQTQIINNKIKRRIGANQSQKLQLLDNNLYWILKHLLLPHNKIVTNSLPIFVTETLFFKDSEMSQLFITKDFQEPTIKRVAKQKLSNIYVQKIMSQRRRKYKDYIRTKTGRAKLQQKKRLYINQKEAKKQIKDAVTIRYIDGYEQLISQNQFMNLFLRRRQDPIWRQIVSIRNFLNITNPQQTKGQYFVVKFKRDKLKYQQLYFRTQLLMKINGKNIAFGQKNYISQQQQIEFRKQMIKKDRQMYAEYLTYQIVSFIQYFYDQQINNLVIGIYFDEIDIPFINQVYKLETKSLIKFEWTDQIYRQRIDYLQSKILQKRESTTIEVASPSNNILVRAMHNAYQKMRNVFGLTAEEEDDQQQVKNNKFFRQMHPQFKHNISQILRDPKLNLNQFRKVYLGQKQKKKPIVRQFTSNMIRFIHDGSPPFKRAKPHDFFESPKRHSSLLSAPTDKFGETQKSFIISPVKKKSISKLYQTLPVK